MGFLTSAPIDFEELLARARGDRHGGVVVFLGVVRNEDDGHPVSGIEYTAYEPMAEREMAKISRELSLRHPTTSILFQHRLGVLPVGEASVAIVASSPHREAAFEACREAIEGIKARVPIWKRQF